MSVTVKPPEESKIQEQPRTSSIEEINQLINETQNPSWGTRMFAFEELQKFLGNKATSLPNFTVFEKIIQIHFDHLNDKHFKVQQIVIENISKLLSSFGETLEPYLGEIIP